MNLPKSGMELDGSSEWPLIFGGGGGGGRIDWFELDDTTGARNTTLTVSPWLVGGELAVPWTGNNFLGLIVERGKYCTSSAFSLITADDTVCTLLPPLIVAIVVIPAAVAVTMPPVAAEVPTVATILFGCIIICRFKLFIWKLENFVDWQWSHTSSESVFCLCFGSFFCAVNSFAMQNLEYAYKTCRLNWRWRTQKELTIWLVAPQLPPVPPLVGLTVQPLLPGLDAIK